MQIALECPTELLDDIQPLADFDFALTHLVLSDEKYAEWYRNSKRFKILDNSTNELLQPCSLKDIQKAVDIIKPDLVVAPDFLGDSEGTFEALFKSFNTWDSEKILPVIQGKNLEDISILADSILEFGFTRIAVPYDITCSRSEPVDVMAFARRKIVRLLYCKGFEEIHLLGFTNLSELEDYAGTGMNVESIDTGSPVLHGLLGLRFGIDKLLPKVRPTMEQMPDFQDTITPGSAEVLWKEVFYNIAMLRKVCNGTR